MVAISADICKMSILFPKKLYHAYDISFYLFIFLSIMIIRVSVTHTPNQCPSILINPWIPLHVLDPSSDNSIYLSIHPPKHSSIHQSIHRYIHHIFSFIRVIIQFSIHQFTNLPLIQHPLGNPSICLVHVSIHR